MGAVGGLSATLVSWPVSAAMSIDVSKQTTRWGCYGAHAVQDDAEDIYMYLKHSTTAS